MFSRLQLSTEAQSLSGSASEVECDCTHQNKTKPYTNNVTIAILVKTVSRISSYSQKTVGCISSYRQNSLAHFKLGTSTNNVTQKGTSTNNVTIAILVKTVARISSYSQKQPNAFHHLRKTVARISNWGHTHTT